MSPDGKMVEHSVEAGTVNLNPSSTHVVENLGDTPFEGLVDRAENPKEIAAKDVNEPQINGLMFLQEQLLDGLPGDPSSPSNNVGWL